MYVMPNLELPAPLRPLGCGVNPAAMTELKDQIKAALEAKEVEFVMGWQKGFDGLHATPLYMRKPEDVEKLIWGPLNVHSLATYLPLFKGKKVGIVVKAATPAASWNSCRRTSSTVRTWSSSAWAATEPSTSTACSPRSAT